MSFLKKQFVWIVLAIILLAEGGVTFMLLGKKGDAKAKLEDLAGKRKRRDELAAMDLKNPERRERAIDRKERLIDQCGTCALFFWYRDQKIESLFDPTTHQGLAKFDIKPWDERSRALPSFRLAFGNAYNREAEKLSAKAHRLNIDRAGLGLASDTAFPQPHVTVGDIYSSLKEFWIRKEIVDLAVAADVTELDPIIVTRADPRAAMATRRSRRSRSSARKATKKESKLFKPIMVNVVVRCKYSKLAVFVSKLLASPLSFRIKSMEEAVRSKPTGSTGKRSSRRSVRRPGVPPMGEGMMEGPPVGVRSPTIRPDMMMEEGMPPPPRTPAAGMAMEGEMGVAGRRTTRAAGAGEQLSAAEQLVEAHITCEVSDFALDLARAKFTGKKLGKKAAVKAWLQARIAAAKARKRRRRGLARAVSNALAAAETLVWRKTLVALDSDTVKEAGRSVEISYRPKEHFGKGPGYTHLVKSREGDVEVEFKILTFEPRESDQGIAQAVSAR